MATATSLKTSGVYVVLRHQKEIISEYLTKSYPAAIQVEQDEIAGTGRAVEVSLSKIPADFSGDVLVISGDVPLMDTQTLTDLVAAHRSGKASATILTALLEDPSGYGRIIRGSDGQVAKIVEHLDATEAELAISEINWDALLAENMPLAADKSAEHWLSDNVYSENLKGLIRGLFASVALHFLSLKNTKPGN
jgi:bifunctional UDP-N-acetylglucosamine pyrophosphorylase/glucosamine-1-phosphate N-acetyltransferase